MNQMEYKGYTAIVEFDGDDECFVGHVVGITDRIAFDGESIEELRQNLHTVVDTYLAHCEKTGQVPETPKSGRLLLRLPPELHSYLYHQAETTGESVNGLIVDAVQRIRDKDRRVAARTVAKERAPRQRRAKATAGK